MCGWLLLVAEFDACEGFIRFGLGSTARWLAHACGLAGRTATDHLRVARCLSAHPRLAAEMSAGRLSYSQVRAISRVVGSQESTLVDDLIEVARHGTVAHLEVIVRGLRAVDAADAGAPEDRERLTTGWTAESLWRLSARLDPERGAVVDAALHRVVRVEGVSSARALVRLAEIGLASLADGAKPPRPLRGDERAAVVVSIDIAAVDLAGAGADVAAVARVAADEPDAVAATPAPNGSAEPTPPRAGRPYARIVGGPGLPDHVVKRLLCDARVRTIVRDGPAHVLDVGRSRRLVTDRQYRALLVRHRDVCAYPGCGNARSLQAHHIVPWLAGGRTDLSNLILLCEAHHHAHHDGEFTITVLPRGRFRFVRAAGSVLPDVPDVRMPSDAAPVEADYSGVKPDAATSAWDGQRLDRAYAIAVLAERRQRYSRSGSRSGSVSDRP